MPETERPRLTDAENHMRAAVRIIVQRHQPQLAGQELEKIVERLAGSEFKFVSDVASSDNFRSILDNLRTEESSCGCGEGGCGCGHDSR